MFKCIKTCEKDWKKTLVLWIIKLYKYLLGIFISQTQYIFNEYQLNQIRKKAYSSLEFFKNNIQNVIGDLFLEISDIMENI